MNATHGVCAPTAASIFVAMSAAGTGVAVGVGVGVGLAVGDALAVTVAAGLAAGSRTAVGDGLGQHGPVPHGFRHGGFSGRDCAVRLV